MLRRGSEANARGDDASHGSPPPPSLLDIQREEEARAESSFGSPSPKNFSPNFSRLGGSSPASAGRSWYVPDSGRGAPVGLRALLAEEEDARLAAELAAAEADAAAKIKVPPVDEKENANKHMSSRRTRAGNPRPGGNPRSTDGTKGGNRKDDKTGDGEDEAGRRHRPPAKKKASSSPEASNRGGAGAGADEAALGGGRRGRVGGDGSGPAKPRASPKGTKPRESEPPQRGNGRGGRSRRGAPQQP